MSRNTPRPRARTARPDQIERLARVAARASQRGHFTARQAARCGISAEQLTAWVRDGLVERAARGVYRFVVGPAPTFHDQLAGRLLATGGAASGPASLALYGVIPPPTDLDVMSVRGHHRAAGVVHTSRDLRPRELTTVGGLRALHPVRAIIDAASTLSTAQLRAAIESAVVRNLVDPFVLERRARELRHPRRPGCAKVLAVLAELHPELAMSRNAWEALVVRLVAEAGLPEPRLEYRVSIDGETYYLDLAWPEELVTLEFDGRDPHMLRSKFDQDATRRNDLESAGWKRFTATATDARNGLPRTLAQVRVALAERAQRSA